MIRTRSKTGAKREPQGRAAWCAVVLLALAGCDVEPATTPPVAIARACDFLWSQQAADGGWHSAHYGRMRSGQSLTSFVLATLLSVPEVVHRPRPGQVKRAADFLVANLHASGGLGLADPATVDYPCYATGLALGVLQRLGSYEAAVARMRRYLLDQHFGEAAGWAEDHPAFGAWGMGGAQPQPVGQPGHVDLSMNRVVLQGLRGGAPLPPAVLRASRKFLARCQNVDGGFHFSPVEAGINKGGESRAGRTDHASYGSATADGILALLAAGYDESAEPVRKASRWLLSHHRIDRVPGIPTDGPLDWSHALVFYYRAVSAEAFTRLGADAAPLDVPWREVMIAELLPIQRADGSWVNAVGSVKEDDPILATGLALRALVAAHKH